jgi:hypothetical protein
VCRGSGSGGGRNTLTDWGVRCLLVFGFRVRCIEGFGC